MQAAQRMGPWMMFKAGDKVEVLVRHKRADLNGWFPAVIVAAAAPTADGDRQWQVRWLDPPVDFSALYIAEESDIKPAK